MFKNYPRSLTRDWMINPLPNLIKSQKPTSRMTSPPPPSTLSVSTTSAPAINGQTTAGPTRRLRFADVGVNLGDPVFRGVYHGKKAHDDDLNEVLQRAVEVGCIKMMVTGSDLEESEKAVEMARDHPGLLYATVGVHPCTAHTFDTNPSGPISLLQSLENLAIASKANNTCTAFGEIGLDYDRLFLCPRATQLKYFAAQLDLAIKIQLPLFLHSRAAGEDFERLLRARQPHLPKRGLVHSFTGTMGEMLRLVEMGFDIGVNGCSMKTDENMEVVKALPLEWLQIETDGPWCEMRPSHASAKHKVAAPALPRAVKKEKWERGLMVKGRNEPVGIVHVAYAIASIKGLPVEEVCEAAWNNSMAMFGLGESMSG